MRDSMPSPPRRHPRIVWSGAILVIIGLSLLVVLGEGFAAYDACVANPACNAVVPVSTLETFLALMVVGVGLVVSGLVIAAGGARGELRRAMIIWL